MNSQADKRLALNDFFVSVQAKALRQAEIATGNRDDALDILQEAMIKLASNYAQQTQNWPQLFQRILQNAIRDWFRRKKVRNWLSFSFIEKDTTPADNEAHEDSFIEAQTPEELMVNEQHLLKIENALQLLPQRQQQAFMLRAWWGANTEETADAMQCSSGSVKTHYSRALAKLRELLEDIQ